MKKETYERMRLVITEFETEDVITTSGPGDDPGTGGGGGGTPTAPDFTPTTYEIPLSI